MLVNTELNRQADPSLKERAAQSSQKAEKKPPRLGRQLRAVYPSEAEVLL